MKRAFAYIRVSKDRKEMVSPEQQLEKAELQARLMGLDLVEVFQDIDITGKTMARPEFQRMFNEIKAGKCDVLIVYKLDRFARNVRQFHNYMDILDKHNCSLVSVSQQFDTSTPTGRLLRNILVDFAEFESDMIGERIRDSKATNARLGRWNGGHAPYGYRAENKQLVIHEEEAEIVRIAYELRSQGWGVLAISKELNARGFKSRRGTSWGVSWSEGTVKHMLKNRTYAGDMVYGDEVVLDAFPPIVDRETFDKAQFAGQLPSRSQAAPHLLSGLLYCHNCGKISFQVNYNGNKNARVRRYTCRTKRWKNAAACASPLLDADSLEAIVIQNIFALVSDTTNLDSAAQRKAHEQQQQVNLSPKDKERIQAEILRVQRVMRELFSDYYDSHIITREQFQEKNNEYLQQEAELKARLEDFDMIDQSMQSINNDAELLKNSLTKLHDNWEYMSPEEKRMAIRSIIREITIFPDSIEIDFFLFKTKVPGSRRKGTLYF